MEADFSGFNFSHFHHKSMGFESLWLSRFGFKHPWIPVTCLTTAFVWMIVFLAGCYAISSGDGHLQSGLPAISSLGDETREDGSLLEDSFPFSRLIFARTPLTLPLIR
jgi:hypothetical protein